MEISNKQHYSFEIMLQLWMRSNVSVRHSQIKILMPNALISPSWTKAEICLINLYLIH